jgi:hypothetical protein
VIIILSHGLRAFLAGIGLAVTGVLASAQEAPRPANDPAPAEEQSPWLLAPVLTTDPKLGTTVGALGGYIHYFDEKSRPSIFAVTGQYTNTDSIVGGLFAKTSFDEDGQRLNAGLFYGNVNNDYDDYLGTGAPLKSNVELRAVFARYLYRIWKQWFIGAQGMHQNFAIAGETPVDQDMLDVLGITPFKSGGLGLVVYRDSRDSDTMPTRGGLFNFNNMAYRESLGGQDNYDVYRVETRYFVEHGKGNVFAIRQLNHFTDNAPTQSRAAVQLRGYKVGQYNGEYMSSIEGEERLRLGARWTATIFAGIACTYGGGQSCSEGANVYPAAGAGIQYVLKPREKIVLNLEYAQGEGSNHGVYLKMGYAF